MKTTALRRLFIINVLLDFALNQNKITIHCQGEPIIVSRLVSLLGDDGVLLDVELEDEGVEVELSDELVEFELDELEELRVPKFELELFEEESFLFDGVEIILPVSKSISTAFSSISLTEIPSTPSITLTCDSVPLVWVPVLDSDLLLLFFFPQPQNKTIISDRTANIDNTILFISNSLFIIIFGLF